MDKNYLDKVVKQIVRETNYRDDEKYVDIPWIKQGQSIVYYISDIKRYYFSGELNIPQPFTKHCEEVYGLNEDETRYVWDKYVYTLLTL